MSKKKHTTTTDWARDLVAEMPKKQSVVLEAELGVLNAQVSALTECSRPAVREPCLVTVVRTTQQLTKLAEDLLAAPVVVIDLETAGLDPSQGEIVGIGLAVGASAYYIPTGHRFPDTGQLLPDQPVVADVVDRLQFNRLRFVAHNVK